MNKTQLMMQYLADAGYRRLCNFGTDAISFWASDKGKPNIVLQDFGDDGFTYYIESNLQTMENIEASLK